jgi:hypothetical protein
MTSGHKPYLAVVEPESASELRADDRSRNPRLAGSSLQMAVLNAALSFKSSPICSSRHGRRDEVGADRPGIAPAPGRGVGSRWRRINGGRSNPCAPSPTKYERSLTRITD